MKYKAVIFDMDGVLVDSEPLHVSVESNMIKELGIPLKKEMYSKFAGTTSLCMWKTLIEEFRLEKDPKELSVESDQRFVNELLHTDKVQLFDGVLDVLKKLYKGGIPIALASSSSKKIVEAVLRKFDIANYFTVIVTGSDVQQSKPHPEIFLLAAKKLDVPPSLCVVIEDSPNGVKAAKNAGIYCIGFKPIENHHDLKEASRIISSFYDFSIV